MCIKDDPYDYSEEFSLEEMYEEEEYYYKTLEEELREVGMSISDFL